MSGQTPVKVQSSRAVLPHYIAPLQTQHLPVVPNKLTVTQLRTQHTISSEHSKESSAGSHPAKGPLALSLTDQQSAYMSLASGADSGSQLPLFQANQAIPTGMDANAVSTAQSSGSTRASDPLASAPAFQAPRASARGSVANKRSADRTADSSRKQARLTGPPPPPLVPLLASHCPPKLPCLR
jgi:hypothetical protein